MKVPHFALSGVLALGLLGGCGSYYGSVGVTSDPYDYYTVGTYDGPDYVFYRDNHYYYDGHHRDDAWRHAHERERIRLDHETRERYAREWNESRARVAGHEQHHDDYHDDHDHH